MARDQACKLQILSAKHPDLLQVVEAMFEKFATIGAVRRMIEHRYHEDVGVTAISNYKKSHWKVFKDMVREKKAAMLAIAEIIGEDGLTAGVNALLWQELQGMTAPQLMAFKKVLNDGEKVALMKKQFALRAQEHRQRMKERMGSSTDDAGTGDPAEDYAKAERVVQQVKEIFGIGMTAPGAPGQARGDGAPAVPPALSAAQQEPVSR